MRISAAALDEADIVFTTYHTLVAEFTEKLSPLHKIYWFRVVLDEGKGILCHCQCFHGRLTLEQLT